jgi:hypothetical protein
LEEDLKRKRNFEEELGDIGVELERFIELLPKIPKRDEDIAIQTSLQIKAFGVLEAMLDLIGQQLSYFQKSDTFHHSTVFSRR